MMDYVFFAPRHTAEWEHSQGICASKTLLSLLPACAIFRALYWGGPIVGTSNSRHLWPLHWFGEDCITFECIVQSHRNIIMSVWCSFFTTSPAICFSNIGLQLRRVTA